MGDRFSYMLVSAGAEGGRDDVSEYVVVAYTYSVVC